ncbi:MAG: sugar ABC transporter permease [Clostridiales bacterium]|nr:sugar ABC transporter permease [Clostridiales bacterium]
MAVALVYPVIRFCIMWGYVNFNSILSTVSQYDPIKDIFVIDGSKLFLHWDLMFQRIFGDENTRRMVLNSFLYFPVTCFITLPLSVFFSYFLYKKVLAGSVFRVIFYLPSILPIAVLTMSFRFAFDTNGFINPMLRALGFNDPPIWWGNSSVTPSMVFVYCVWAGLGFNIVLLGGAMSRVPIELSECGRLEGIGFIRELFQVMIPLVWPTIVTTFILGMSSVLTVFLQPLFLTGGGFGSGTISLYIFTNYGDTSQGPFLAAFGLFCTLCYVPVILLTRWFMNRFFSNVSY